jgi:hypothetical protein
VGAEDMTVPLTPTNATNHVARAALRALRERADLARSRQDGRWRNVDVLAAFLRVLDGTDVHVDRPGVVRVVTPPTRHGWVWSYVGKEALEAARRRYSLIGVVRSESDHAYVLIFDPTIEL